jgi:hypothetical protein
MNAPPRRRLVGTPETQRWQTLGGLIILLAPLLAGAVGLANVLLTPSQVVPAVPPAVRIGALVFTLGLVAFPLFLFWRAQRGWRRPPLPAGDLGPRSVALGTPGGVEPSAGSVNVGPVAASPMHVTVWNPGRSIQLHQPPVWDRPLLIAAALVAVALFIAAPSYERGALSVGIPESTWRWLGAWALLGSLWVALPTRPRTATLDWAGDRLEVAYGRRRRTLGLSRVRGVELRIDQRNKKTGTQATGMITTHTIVAWVQPDGAHAVPFVLTESNATDVEEASEAAHQQLVRALAAALNVPAGRPQDAADVKPYH